MIFVVPVALGILQGLTEFLPVSSSGHLAVASLLLGVRTDHLGLEVGLHLGTIAAVAWMYRPDLGRLLHPPWGGETRQLALGLIAASLVTGMLALFFRGAVTAAFSSTRAIGLGFAATTLLLAASRRMPGGRREAPSTAAAVFIGAAQGIATFPGLSRSGATIVAGLGTGLGAEAAARFSFLLALPAVAAASALTLTEGGVGPTGLLPWLAGVVVSAAVGAASIALVKRTMVRRRLHLFALYTGALALLCFLLP